MSVNYDLLDELGLSRGNPPMHTGQFRRRIEAYIDREWPELLRMQDPASFDAWKMAMMPTVAEAQAALAFNFHLANYRAALARLAQYRLADGRPEIVTQQETGEIDPETGEPAIVDVVTPAIAPLPAEIEQAVYDPETGEATGTGMVPNPEIAADDAERAAAQAVIDGTPQEVIDFTVV